MAFCERSIHRCPDCGKTMPKAEQEQHRLEEHAPVQCECGAEMPKDMLATHKESTCPMRSVACEWCNLKFRGDAFEEHARACGSRTERCDECKRYVRLSDMGAHQQSNCQFPPQT